MDELDLNPQKDGLLQGRTVEFFHHDSKPEWGYVKPQKDCFAVIHPKTSATGNVPLYVVFHSAGHDVFSCVGTTWAKGNHDIYHAPENMYALYLDCRFNEGDWWWGGVNAKGDGDSARHGVNLQPVENRCLATIRWVMEHYPIDAERVYAVGNSMGGSGALGIALNHGDLFAAIKVNVPAGVRHAADRCCLDTPAPEGFSIPEPPPLIDYSAQDDEWSNGHEILYRGMRDRRYSLIGYWGAFGHANNNEIIEKENDLVHSFDLFSVVKNAAYPVFTGASTDDPIPWPDHRDSKAAGQVNGFFRWENITDSPDAFAMLLSLMKQSDWKTRVTIPAESTAEVSLRRLQNFRIAPGEKFRWAFGENSGTASAGSDGLITLPRLKISGEPTVLELSRV